MHHRKCFAIAKIKAKVLSIWNKAKVRKYILIWSSFQFVSAIFFFREKLISVRNLELHAAKITFSRWRLCFFRLVIWQQSISRIFVRFTTGDVSNCCIYFSNDYQVKLPLNTIILQTTGVAKIVHLSHFTRHYCAVQINSHLLNGLVKSTCVHRHRIEIVCRANSSRNDVVPERNV